MSRHSSRRKCRWRRNRRNDGDVIIVGSDIDQGWITDDADITVINAAYGRRHRHGSTNSRVGLGDRFAADEVVIFGTRCGVGIGLDISLENK